MNTGNLGPSGMDSAPLLALVQAGKVADAIAVLEADPNQMEAARAFIQLSKQTYRELQDISSMVALANAGTEFALLKAGSSDNSLDSEKFKELARILAFNTAANCWPGWGDAGVDIKDHHLQAGLKLAVLCRDLVVELNLGHKERGTSHWLIGALGIAMGLYEEAMTELQRARAEFQAWGNSNLVLMAEGYMALALKAQPDHRLAGDHELSGVLRLLGDQGSKEAQFFANQLMTADRMLIRVGEV